MAKDDRKLPSGTASAKDVDAFLDKLSTMPTAPKTGVRGRLIFAMDATASRQPTWDTAASIQGEMFRETQALGGLDIQLAFYRGFGEFKASNWARDGQHLLRLMTSVHCHAGQTQIAKVLKHAANETRKKKVNALVFVGDCCEEDIDHLGHLAGELGILGVPAFMFHEGTNPVGAFAFKEIARLSGGACCEFDASSAETLKRLLNAVAVFAAGGRPALEDYASRAGSDVKRLTAQLGRG